MHKTLPKTKWVGKSIQKDNWEEAWQESVIPLLEEFSGAAGLGVQFVFKYDVNTTGIPVLMANAKQKQKQGVRAVSVFTGTPTQQGSQREEALSQEAGPGKQKADEIAEQRICTVG